MARRRVEDVGGGAAGFFGASRAAELGAGDTLLPAGDAPLAKVRLSGGGRCNVTHHEFDVARFLENYPRGARELRGVFARFG
ncbi:MAG: NAD(P)/FAD-dependent oxidoreductase, partial [Methanobacteriota archaeon]